MKNLLVSLLFLADLLIPSIGSAYNVEFFNDSWKTNGVAAGTYSDNVPNGWTFDSNYSKLKLLSDRTGKSSGDVEALGFDCSSCSTAGKYGDLKMDDNLCVPYAEIVCDNLVVDLNLYVRPLETYKTEQVDKFQLIATTNNWVDTILVGSSIPMRAANYVEGWRTFTIKESISGISVTNENYSVFKIGLRALAGRSSYTYEYVHGISVAFEVCATPKQPSMVSDATNDLDSVFAPGEIGRMKAVVDASPTNKFESLQVFGVLSRQDGHGIIVVTNELENIGGKGVFGGVYYEKLSDVINRRPLDAGEILTCSVITKYKSNDSSISPYGKIGEDGYAYEFSDSASYNVGKWGSVWVNELGREKGECFVELCGTTNRAYVGGWKIILSGTNNNEFISYTNVIENAFDFIGNMTNGVVGIETHRWAALDDVVLTNAKLELINSSGVVEFSKTNLTWPAHYQMTGRAKWQGKTDDDWSYDWTGTSTNGTFVFEQTDVASTPNRVNDGQGFLAPVKSTLHLTTVINGTSDTLAYASVSIAVDGILNGEEGVTNFTGQTSAETGTADIEIKGYSDDASRVEMSSSVAAFAWKCDEIVMTNSLYEGDLFVTNVVRSTVAYDDFSELKEYWENWSNIKNMQSKIQYWGIGLDGKRKQVLQLDTQNGYKGYATLTTKSYMSTRGKKYLDVAFDFTNESMSEVNHCTTVKILIADSLNFDGEVVCETIGLDNKSTSYGKGVPYLFRQVMELPSNFALKEQVWVRIQATKNYQSTSVYTTLDNLRVAAVDSVKINSLDVPELPTGASAFPLEFPEDVTLDLTPLTGGIVSNFEEKVVGEVTVTNLVSVTTNCVRDVRADLVMSINGTEFEVPFQFAGDQWTNPQTNDISAAYANVALKIAPSNVTEAIKAAIPGRALLGGFHPGDVVKYYARVSYDPDDADDDRTEPDVRYSPENERTVATDTGWYAKSLDLSTDAYLPGTNDFSVTGPAIAIIGPTNITADGISFQYNAWDAEGVGITNLTITLDGKATTYEWTVGEAPKQVTDLFLGTDLTPYSAHTLSITAVNANGKSLTDVPLSFEFETLPAAPAVTIKGVSTDAVEVSASCASAGFVVEPDAAYSDWVRTGANPWTFTGGTPNTNFVVTVWATNKFGLAGEKVTTNGYTLAAAATRAPCFEKEGSSVRVWAEADYAKATGGFYPDGNPERTEYAVRVTTDDGKSVIAWTNVYEGGEIVSTNEVWMKLSDWANPVTLVGTPQAKSPLNLDATNVFSFVTRNGAAELSESDETTNCVFDIVVLEINPEQRKVKHGAVDLELVLRDPAQSDHATAVVEYEVFDWDGTKTLYSGKVCDDFTPKFDEMIITNDVSWDAWTAVGQKEGNYKYQIYVTVSTQSRTSGRTPMGGLGALYYAPPANLAFEDNPLLSDPLTGELVATNVTDFSFTASAEVAHKDGLSYIWTTNGVACAGTGATCGGEGIEGTNTVTVYAVDAYSNVCAVIENKWVIDLSAPANLAINGWPLSEDPAKLTITNGYDFAFTATAEDLTAITYHWTTNEAAYAGTEGACEGRGIEGTNAVVVWAEDIFHHASAPVTNRWIVDTTPPDVELSGDLVPTDPAQLVATKETGCAYVAVVQDLTDVTYAWYTNDTLVAGADKATLELVDDKIRFFADGTNKVVVVVTDAAGNWSAATNKWIVDTAVPAWDKDPIRGALVSDDPTELVVTNGTDFSFTAVATDKTAITYTWATNGTVVAGATGATLALGEGAVTDGTNYVVVTVVDAAGNPNPVAVTNFWICDTHAPELALVGALVADPLTGALVATNVTDFSFAAVADDLTAITYAWYTNGAAVADCDKDVLSGSSAFEGTNTVVVFATDEANNTSSVTNDWIIDVTPPTWNKPALTGELVADPTTGELKVTKQSGATFTASASDNLSKVEYAWYTNDVLVAGLTAATFTAQKESFGEGTNTVVVWVKDVAGNVGSAVTNKWIIDLHAPKDLAFNKDNPLLPDPLTGKLAVTNGTDFSFTASATDLSTITYTWETNGTVVAGATGPTFALGKGAVTDGTNTVVVWATDRADNASTVTNQWIVDTTAPTNLVLKGALVREAGENLVLTNGTDASFSVSALDLTAITYCWYTNGVLIADSDTTAFDFAEDAFADGTNTVVVRATDEAGNASAVTNKWIVDTQAPTVTLTSATPATFNEYKVPLVVNVKFSETVVGFTKDSVTVTRGAITNFVEVAAGTGYTLYIDPDDEEDDETFVPVSVQVEECEVKDLAGNDNTASNAMNFRNVTKLPTATLKSATPDCFNRGPFVLTATFVRGKNAEPANVTNLTADCICVTNGTERLPSEQIQVSPAFGDADYPTNVYTIAITPLTEGPVSVMIPADVVFDTVVGNPNVASDVMTKTYDITPPTVPVLTGIPVSTDLAHLVATNGAAFNLTATAMDAISSVANYRWTLNGSPVSGLTSPDNFFGEDLPEGTNAIVVSAVDAAGNEGGAVTNKWVVDPNPPQWGDERSDKPITGTPEKGAETNTTDYALTAHATDKWTKLSYSWELAFGGKALATGSADRFTGSVTEDGDYVASVWVTDEAGNVSTTNTWGWTVDTKAPENLKISGEFVQKEGEPPVITKNTGFTFEASATDTSKKAVEYFWMTNEVLVADATNTLEGVAIEGTNWVVVVAKDAAGNVSAPVTNMWIVDTTPPQKPDFNDALCTPAKSSATNVTDYSFTIYEITNDLTTVTYHWQLVKDGALSGDEFSAEAPKGLDFSGEVDEETEVTRAYEALVWAVDAAGNVSPTNVWDWTYDTVKPVLDETFGGTPTDLSITNDAGYALSMGSTKQKGLTYHWALVTNNFEFVRGWEAGKATFGGAVPVDGVYTAMVYTVDAAGNVSATNTMSWIYDATKPSVPAIAGEPADRAITTETGYSYTASSQDATACTYTWTFDGGDEVLLTEGLAFTDKGVTDGKHTVSVYATDAAGNRSDATNWTWTVDTEAPTNLVLTGTHGADYVTRETGYDFALDSMDLTATTNHWTLKRGGETVRSAELEKALSFTSKDDAELADGTYAVSVFARDAVGHDSIATNWTWIVDTEAPQDFAVAGWPQTGAVTNQATKYTLAASANDPTSTKVFYQWNTNGFDVAGFSGTPLDYQPIEGTNTVIVYAYDAASNCTESVTNWWIVDTIAPTGIVITDELKNGKVTSNSQFKFSATADDATACTFHWALNGQWKDEPGKIFEDGVTADGVYTASVYAVDAAMNVSATNDWVWTVDTTPPTDLTVTGTPASNSTVRVTSFALAATAEDATAITMNWSLEHDGKPVTNAALKVGETFSRETLADGDYVAYVYAEDAAGNVTDTNAWNWTVDTAAPQWNDPKVVGWPETGAVTNQATAYTLAASASDPTSKVSYQWNTNGFDVAGFSGTPLDYQPIEGTNTVIVYAYDAASNCTESVTNWWIVDTIAPANIVITDELGNGEITSNTNHSFSATADDATACQFYWALNGQWRDEPGATFEGAVAADGVYTASVYAVDAAMNVSVTNDWVWTVDTTPPQRPDFNDALCSPAKSDATNVTDYTFAIYEITNDLTAVTYHWQLTKDGALSGDEQVATAPDGLAFSGNVSAEPLADISYKALVWAVDAAGNSSATNEWGWTYDTTPPGDPEFDEGSTPAKDSVTSVSNYNLTASSTEANAYYWTLTFNGESVRTGTGATFKGDVAAEGVYTALVYTVDKAGNVSQTTNGWAWTFDQTAPIISDIEGVTPEYGCETNSAAYELSASSEDANPGMNFWALVKDGAVVAQQALPAANDAATVFKGEVNAGDGVYTAKFWSVDAAGNASAATNSWAWTVDTVKPVLDDEFGGTPADGDFTNDANFALSMGSTKPDGLTYHWALLADDGTFVREWETGASQYAGAVEADGVYTAMVYTVDRAGNHSATNTMAWTYDKTPPMVTLTTTAPDCFDAEYIRTNGFEVTVTFGERISDFEPIPDFVESCVTIANGTSKGGTKISETEYSFKITPGGSGPISVTVAADAVKDLAGNGNVASKALSRLYVEFVADNDDKPLPTIDLSGYPLSGSTTNEAPFELTAKTTEVEIAGEDVVIDHYYWCVNGVWLDETEATISGLATQGVNTVSVYGIGSGDYEGCIIAKSATWTWTYQKDPEPTPDVDFGGGVRLPVDPTTGETNEVKIVAVSFQPGADSTVTMTGFEADGAEITDLQMWFIVSETVTGEKSREAVSGTATFDSAADPKTLTVTLPAKATEDKASFFIFGVDNRAE